MVRARIAGPQLPWSLAMSPCCLRMEGERYFLLELHVEKKERRQDEVK